MGTTRGAETAYPFGVLYSVYIWFCFGVIGRFDQERQF